MIEAGIMEPSYHATDLQPVLGGKLGCTVSKSAGLCYPFDDDLRPVENSSHPFVPCRNRPGHGQPLIQKDLGNIEFMKGADRVLRGKEVEISRNSGHFSAPKIVSQHPVLTCPPEKPGSAPSTAVDRLGLPPGRWRKGIFR